MCKTITCKCKTCKRTFTIRTSKGRPPAYCSKRCRDKGYKEKQKKAKKKYKKKQQGKPHEEKCRYCGNTFITKGNTKYCSKRCRTYARQDNNLLAVIRYKKKTHNEKQEYFAYLGNSNIRHDNRKQNWIDELKVIRAEKQRLGI